jgi:hypothetical protein
VKTLARSRYAREVRQEPDADGAPFRVPALPVERNGGNIGEWLKVPVPGADTESVSAELKNDLSSTDNAA